jgi:hypothetical protein
LGNIRNGNFNVLFSIVNSFEDDLSTQLASDNPKESNLGVLGLEIAVATNFWILSCHQRTA